MGPQPQLLQGSNQIMQDLENVSCDAKGSLFDAESLVETSQRLIDWYWTFGKQRTGSYRLSGKWLHGAYECADRALALASISQLAVKPNLAVWGQSQTGKSTLLATLIDNPAKSNSAMTWGNAKRYIFSTPSGKQRLEAKEKGIEIPEEFNPFNAGADGSAVVGRYYLSDGNDFPEEKHPISLEMGTTRDLLFALAVGYLGAVDKKLDDDSERIWDGETFAEAVDEISPEGETPPEREAVELAIAFTQAIDDLIAGDQYKRYTNLQQSDFWNSRLRDELLNRASLMSDVSTLKRLIARVLWDDSPLVSDLFDDLYRVQKRISSLLGNRSLYTSVELARSLVNMKLHADLEKGRKEASQNTRRSTITLRSEDDYVVLERDATGSSLFEVEQDYAYGMGLLQACCWELAIPLNQTFFEEQGVDASVLESMSVLDIPGITNEGEIAPEERLARDGSQQDGRVFKNLIKRGKTFSIIGKYARDLKVDALLLLTRSAMPLPQPALIADGVQAIFRAVDSGYTIGQRALLPIPLTLNFTFFSKVVNEAFAGGENYDFGQIDEHLAAVGSIVSTDNAYAFVTNYPQLPAGALNPEVIEHREHVEEICLGEYARSWTASRFREVDEQESLSRFWDEDGGVHHMLNSQSRLVDSHKRRARIERLLLQTIEGLYQLVVEAGPEFDDDGERAKLAVAEIGSRLKGHLGELQDDSEEEAFDAIERLSGHLKAAFSCYPEDFEALAASASKVRQQRLEAFLVEALNRWTTSTRRREALHALGVSSRDTPLVLDSLTNLLMADFDRLVEWSRPWFDPTKDDGEEHQVNAMRYLAAFISNTLKKNMPKRETNLAQGLREHCEEKFDSWSRKRALANIEIILEPCLVYLEELPDQLGASERQEQVGDDELRSLWEDSGVSSSFALTEDAPQSHDRGNENNG